MSFDEALTNRAYSCVCVHVAGSDFSSNVVVCHDLMFGLSCFLLLFEFEDHDLDSYPKWGKCSKHIT